LRSAREVGRRTMTTRARALRGWLSISSCGGKQEQALWEEEEEEEGRSEIENRQTRAHGDSSAQDLGDNQRVLAPTLPEVRFHERTAGKTSHVTRHTSHVTRHTSHATLHTSHVTRHTSQLSYL
jgi:hypothetical protein